MPELPPHLGQVADEAAAVVVGFGPGPAFGFPDRLQILPSSATGSVPTAI